MLRARLCSSFSASLWLTLSNQIIKIKIKSNSSGIDSRHGNNQNRASSETKAENSTISKIEISNKIRTGSGSEKRNSRIGIVNNRQHSSNSSARNSSKDANNKIEIGTRNRTDNKLRNNKDGHSSNESSKIVTGNCKIETESNSERSNNVCKTRGVRDKSANETSTCVRVQIRSSGTFGNSIGHAPGTPSTAAGSNVVAIAAIAYRTIGTGDTLDAVITSEFTANP